MSGGWRCASAAALSALALLFACDEVFQFDVPALDAATLAVASDASATSAPNELPSQHEPCSADAQCPLPDLHCDTQTGGCFACVLDEDCSSSSPRCDRLQRCVECLVDEDCAPQFTCDRVSRQCQQRCVSREDCGAEAHDCDERRQACVECDNDRECKDAARPYCAAGGSGCVACRQDLDCVAGGYCDEVTGACVQCRDTRDCPSNAACDPTTQQCRKF